MPRVKNPNPKRSLGKAKRETAPPPPPKSKGAVNKLRQCHNKRARYILGKWDARGDLRKAPFKRLVRELVDNRLPGLRMQKSALEVLRTEAERTLHEVFSLAQKFAVHRSTSVKDRTVKSRDFLAALSEIKNPFLDGAVHEVAKIEVAEGGKKSGLINHHGQYVPNAAVMQICEGSLADRLYRRVGAGGVPTLE